MIDVAAHISELLYKRESVTIPGVGTIHTAYQEAVIDHIKGMLYPPSKSLQMDDQLITDDQVLLEYLAEAKQLSREKAQKAIDTYVWRTLESLAKREIVVLPGVGRMYRDYENHLQFLQDNTNFNQDIFGFEPVQFFPIIRSKERLLSEAPVPLDKRVELPADPWYDRLRIKLQPAAAAMLSIALLLLAFTIYFANTYQKDTEAVLKKPVADSPINQKPADQYASVFDGLFGEEETRKEEKRVEAPPVEQEELEKEEVYTDLDTEAVTVAPDQKVGVIIVGAFGSKRNVEKRIKQIYELGYDAYQDQFDGLTRVGAQFTFEQDEQVREVLRLMRRRFDNRAYVLDM